MSNKQGMFKVFYQKYGKVFLVTHIFLSINFFGLCYYLISKGVDVKPYLKKVGIDLSKYQHADKAGNAVGAYAIYKITMPARLAFSAMVVPLVNKILKR
jgi:hypothetical protein